MRIKRRVRAIGADGAPIPAAPVRMRRHKDNALVGSATTDAQGWVEATLDGNPGPSYLEIDGPGGSTRVVSDLVAGMVGGLSLSEIPTMLRALGNGVVTNAGALSATVGGSVVTVSPHLALVEGYPCRLYTSRLFSVAPAVSSTRTDYVAWRVVPGGDEVGRAELVLLEGTAPVQTASLWEEPMVRLDVAGAAVQATVVARGIPTHRKVETAVDRSIVTESPTSTSAAESDELAASLVLPDDAMYDVRAGFGGAASGEIDVAVKLNGSTGTYRTGRADAALWSAHTLEAAAVQGPATVPLAVVFKRNASYVAEHTEVVTEPTEVEVTTFEQVRSIPVGAAIRPWGVTLSTDEQSFYVSVVGNNHNLWKYTVAGAWQVGFGMTGTGNGLVNTPRGLDCRPPSGLVFVADDGNNRIQAFNANGSYNSKRGSFGSGNGQYSSPFDIAYDGFHDYVADSGNDRIQKFNGSTYVAKWATRDAPQAIAFNQISGTLFVGTLGGWVQEFTTSGALVREWAVSSGNIVNGITCGPDGDVWATTNGNRILRYSRLGVLKATHGESGSGSGQFNNPAGIAVATNGEVFVADYFNNRVVVWADVTRTVVVDEDTEITVPATSNPRLFGGCLWAQAVPRT